MPDFEVAVEQLDDFVATVEFRSPPHNFLSPELVRAIGDAYAQLDDDPDCRAILLTGAGRHFCAGVVFGSDRAVGVRSLYDEACRLFSYRKPVIAAVQGGAIGGGLGLALSADLRVAGPGSRLSANFARLGIHHGFGLTVTLPRVVGDQAAMELLYRGTRVDGAGALALGLVDQLAERDEAIRERAVALAVDVAASAPLAVQAIRQTLRGDLHALVANATDRELAEQLPLFATEDFAAGVDAAAERQSPRFVGR